ncbi:MAG: hypothetical protein GF400_02335 [Candidatus Eisenbacteria bacterium]|nr:hypothetical protein [Candidatus Eisenbacteria bacterium]
MRSRIILSLLIAVTVVGLSSSAPAAQWHSMDPATYASTIRVSVDEKELTYYRFDDEKPLGFSIEGPTRMKILVRLRLPMSAESGSCAFDVYRDGEPARAETLSSYPSERAFYISLEDFRPAVIRRIYIDVPTGVHSYEIRPRARCKAEARVFRSADDSPSRVSFAPTEYASVETFYYRDKELVYYMAGPEQEVVLDVIGPTSIKVNSRVLYDETMARRQTYVVGVARDGESEMLYKIETEPSETVVCADSDHLVPSALRHFMLEVPGGEHRYVFRVADTLASGIAFNFYIPRGDLLNEP